MGNRPRAQLFYGLCWSEEGDAWDMGKDEPDGAGDEAERLARSHGIQPPPLPYEQHQAEHKAYWDAQHAITEREPCAVLRHGYHENPCPAIAVKASLITTDWDDGGFDLGARDIEIAKKYDPEWIGQLAEYCKRLGVETTQEPRWWLVTYYG